jgi:hypothetical protein
MYFHQKTLKNDLNHNLTFYIRSVFKILGMYNFEVDLFSVAFCNKQSLFAILALTLHCQNSAPSKYYPLQAWRNYFELESLRFVKVFVKIIGIPDKNSKSY